jgi:hypothetical protein
MFGASRAQGRAVDTWRVHYGFNAMVDFCVWVLETDGLCLAPFDRHTQGSSLLRAMGVDPEHWRAWLHAIVGAQTERADLAGSLSRSSQYPSLAAQSVARAPRRFNPPALWPGHPNVRPWLEELWEQYGPIALERRGEVAMVECSLVERWLQEALSDLDDRPEQLHIHLVRYPALLAYPVPPDAVIVGLDSCRDDPAALLSAVHAAVQALAAE